MLTHTEQNLEQPTIFVGQTHDPRRKYMPEKKERDLWWAYLEGKPDSDWNITRNSKKQDRKRQQQHQWHGPGSTMRAWADEPEPTVGADIIVCESSLINDEGEVEQALSLDPAEGLPTPTGTPGPSEAPIHHKGMGSGKSRAYSPREPSPMVLKLIDEASLQALPVFQLLNFVLSFPNSPPLCICSCTLPIGSIVTCNILMASLISLENRMPVGYSLFSPASTTISLRTT